ncbi:MAG: bifunctional diaminohydroxyphosphoribosylaminopyrimidine deaminase/5-amino-6-(5-phosphoribosylamino)uracil reductase RibD [Pseudomonadota bacterium]
MTPDQLHMARALELARFQYGRTGKNPAVGCVIIDRDGRRISEAATGDEGRPHAEQLALKHLSQGAAAGGTAYVTLEPCHERSTGEASCSARLIEAGIVRVVVATRDKHPQGDCGLSRLREAGIRIETGLSEADALALYEDFFAELD